MGVGYFLRYVAPGFITLWCAAGAFANPLDDGVAFLAGAQQANGGWNSEQVRQIHATTAAIEALQALGEGMILRGAAADFLAAQAVADSDEGARRIVALATEGHDVAILVEELASDADPTEGWGLAADFAADPLDTALALRALARAGRADAPNVPAALAFLAGAQNADGGWGCVRDGLSDVSCTAEALLALAAYRNRFFIDTAVAAAQGFLRAALGADGRIGGAEADATYTTALAARALLASGDDLAPARLEVVAFLEGRQLANGSWGDDALLTAVALQALNALLQTPVCGDGVVNQGFEACDGADLAGQSCGSLGFGGGPLTCTAGCTFDTSGCAVAPSCGDNVINQPSEICDGSELGGATCEDLGFLGGMLACGADCTFDASGCMGMAFCGDGIVNRPEERCDRADFAGASCASLGLGSGTLRCSAGCGFDPSGCAGLGRTTPTSVAFGPGSALCLSGEETASLTLAFPEASVTNRVDVFFLFDDTGSFAGFVPTVTSIFSSLASELTTALPAVSFGFGVGRFEDYGGPGNSFSGESSTGRPFILNQPIITTNTPNFLDLINAALARTAPGFGGDGPETDFEALFQAATGTGFDGDGNDSALDSGPAGANATQTGPGTSGDVPPFSSNVAMTSGTLGGVGFRSGAAHLIILATDVCSVAAYDPALGVPSVLEGAGGSQAASSAFHCSAFPGSSRFGFVSNAKSTSLNTVAGAVAPAEAATVPQTIQALNALGISVIGLSPGGAPIRNPVGPSSDESVLLSAVALLTGATDETGTPLVFNISGGVGPLRDAVIDAVTTAVT
ncbi:MAG: hypothetical protein M3Z21_03030, partial [Pseudomonadota bacterium]|nr:hypothetical protein [Pseudomonadota bacterium]